MVDTRKIRKRFSSEEAYKKYKHRQYDNYYRATALYKRRLWQADEEMAVIKQSCTDRELSKELHRSIKSIEHKRRSLKDGKTRWLTVELYLISEGWT